MSLRPPEPGTSATASFETMLSDLDDAVTALTADEASDVNTLTTGLATANTAITANTAAVAANAAAITALQAQGIKLFGKVSIATNETTTATSYAIGNLATPDRVQNVVLPTNGLIAVAYQAIWSDTVGANAKAAIFVGANQLKTANYAGDPVVQEATQGASTTSDPVGTSSGGLVTSSGAGVTTEVTTGQIVSGSSPGGSAAGTCYIFAAAGTYDISVQFMNIAAGTLSVRNRHLWVWTLG